MKTALQHKAEHTLNIEYPGHTLEAAEVEAGRRAFDALFLIQDLDKQLQSIQFALDEAKQAYFEACQAEQLFRNALDEIAEQV